MKLCPKPSAYRRGKCRSFNEMQRCYEVAGAEMVTVAVRNAMLARAMKLAVEASRLAYESGRMPRKLYASASSPVTGVVGS